ncbi:ketopantoate reductase family protein [Angustibacter sp. McL0619]|uniref:ketopantoate reductase family protein n=1 Tax=Angustibacter sp. McL0619 TaxID=3415676 RepID=UPI003CEA83C4
MRYVVIGAGAIGGAIAARLAQQLRVRVVLVARGERADMIEHLGIHLRTPDQDLVVGVDVARSPADARLRPDDVLLVATKTQQVEAALREWVDAPVFDGEQLVGTARERLPVLLALNGVAAEQIAQRYFDRVFGVCVWLPSVSLQPGEVFVRIAPRTGVLIVGPVPVGREADPLDAVAADLEAADFEVHVVEDVMRWKYRKLLTNLGNAVQALVGPGVEGAGAVSARLREEGAAVLAQAGIEYASAQEEDDWRRDLFADQVVPGEPALMGGSTWQSLARGSDSNEADYLNGEIAAIARAHGGHAPLNAAVQALVRQATSGGKGPGSLTLGELRAALSLR